MRKASLLLSMCVLLSSQSLLMGQAATSSKQISSDMPAIIISGLDAYKDKGPDEAVKAWIKGSAIEGNKDALTQSNSLRTIEEYYGHYLGYEVVGSRDFSPSTKIIYIIMKYDKGPIFCRFVVYKADKQWILVSFDFNVKSQEVFPDQF